MRTAERARFLRARGGQRAEAFDHACAKCPIGVPASERPARGPVHDPDGGDRLPSPELLAGQIDFETAGKTVPPVVTVLFAVEMHHAEDEVATEQVVDDQRGDVAVPPGRIAAGPGGAREVVG
ncbi:hypothetical protein RB196_20245 [Streptomyces sp. PmtA]